jgi:glycosyltransferase involved in cell wall biosynthesis
MQSSPNDNGIPFPQFLRGKRILLATESFGPVNGVSRTTLNLVQYLRRHGVNVAVVAPENSTERDTQRSRSNEIEVRVKGYPLPQNPELSVVYPVTLSTLYQKTFDGPPDLIYLASPASLGFQILLQLRQRRQDDRVPLLLNFQTDLSGYCEILFPVPISTFAVWGFGSVQSYLFRHVSVHTIFYPSIYVRRYLEKSDVPAEKLVNLRRGVDGTMFHPKNRNDDMRRKLAPNGEIILVSVARLAPEKGFEFLAKVARKLEERHFPFKLLIVGGNRNTEVVTEIQDMFGNLVTKGKVVFTGFRKGEELAEAYASGDIFLHCSITETFGLVVLESMASGVPVIARDEGGPREIVVDGKSGYLVYPQDLEGFVRRVLELGGNSKMREQMANESRKLAEEATWDSIGNKVAWKMVEALEIRSSCPKSDISTSKYSWLFKVPGLTSYLSSLADRVRLLGGLGIICGVWSSVIITWGVFKLSLTAKVTILWIRRIFGGRVEDRTAP